MQTHSLEVGDVVEVTTERLAYGGDAVARSDGLAVFIPFAAAGERLRVRIVERRKSFVRAAILEIIEGSPSRREPLCRHFGDCGGCQLQHISYEAQLEAKAAFVRDALVRIGKIDWAQEIPIRHAREFGYRARAQVKIEHVADAGGSHTLRIGFNRAGSRSVCDVESCPVLVPELNTALASLRAKLTAASADGGTPELADFPREIELAAGETGVAFEPELAGVESAAVTQRVLGVNYRFTPATFFQVNPFMLEALVEEAVSGHKGTLAIDLYCGVGLFALQLARSFERVFAVESHGIAAGLARDNAKAAGLRNVRLYDSRVDSWLDEAVKKKKLAPDVVLLDPPRTGAAEAITGIVALKPAAIVYVSCDPTTLARDLRRLIDAGYRLSRVTALDLFPQTHHVETVAVLDLPFASPAA